MLRPSLSSTSTIETTIFFIFAVALLMISQATSDSFSNFSEEEEVRPPQIVCPGEGGFVDMTPENKWLFVLIRICYIILFLLI
jgi:uncharacterized MAPEG superfamily protein